MHWFPGTERLGNKGECCHHICNLTYHATNLVFPAVRTGLWPTHEIRVYSASMLKEINTHSLVKLRKRSPKLSIPVSSDAGELEATTITYQCQMRDHLKLGVGKFHIFVIRPRSANSSFPPRD